MAILTVGPHSTYATIAAAMKAANSADTISLEAGYGNESAIVSVNDLFVTGDSESTGIHLELATGVHRLTLQGDAPIDVRDNAGANTILGNAGANVIEVSGGADVVHGGLGTDRLVVDYATTTSDVIGTSVNISDGGTHSVTFNGIENFTIDTGSGNDTITTGDGANYANTRAGNDTIDAGDGHNRIYGGSGNDTVTAGNGNNDIYGSTGNDTLTAGDGRNLISGGVGNDTITGGDGGNHIVGGAGDDTIDSGAGHDLISAGLGDDTVNAGAGNDRIQLIGGTDRVDGGAGNDTVDYSASALGVSVSLATTAVQSVNTNAKDTLISIENLIGSAHDDTLSGNGANNILTGGLGADHIDGAAGADRFVYASAQDSTSTAHDTITGFDATADRLDLWFTVTGIDTAVTSGALSGASFDSDLSSAIGTSHLSGHHAVLFTANSGSLAGDTFLVIDANGVAGYQAGQDLVVELAGATHLASLATADFI